MSNRVVHFEIPCDDPEKTIAFFQKVFNWKIEPFMHNEYWNVITGDDKQPGINGGLMKRKAPGQPVANSIDDKDMEASIKAIEQNGGIIVVPKMAIPGVGWLSYFKDPDGNIHGLYQHDPSGKL